MLEYKLNKIDTDLRRKVQEITREGKVHGYKRFNKIDKYREEGEQKKNKDFKETFKKYNKNKILVDAVKSSDISVDSSKDAEDLSVGRFLDIKK